MKSISLLILVPCDGIEDFCIHLNDIDANSLLAAWCGSWHPHLLAAAGNLPRWCRLDEIPESAKATVLVVPSGSKELMTPSARAGIADGGGLLILDPQSPDEVFQAVVQEPGFRDMANASGGLDDELVQDFHALGYALLQAQLLTYHMQHAYLTDEEALGRLVVDAAVAAIQGEKSTAHDLLKQCFQLLADQRDNYYPVDVFLLDVNLYHSKCDPEVIERDLCHARVGNLVIGGEELRAMAQHRPDLVQALREGVAAERLTILGGEAIPLPLELVTCESVLRQLRVGLSEYQRHLEAAPHLYARIRFGLTATLPGILQRLPFHAAWHTTLDQGRLPESSQVRGPWQGCDGHSIDKVGCNPLDAGRASTYLRFATRLGESMENDFVATVVLAHWAGSASRWHALLQRVTNHGLVLGRFVNFDTYLQEATDLGHLDSFSADEYRWPYLQQAVCEGQRDPISRWQRYWRWQTRLQAARAFDCWATLIARSPEKEADQRRAIEARDELGDQVDRSLLVQAPTAVAEIEQRVSASLSTAVEKLAAQLGTPHSSLPTRTEESDATAPSRLPKTDSETTSQWKRPVVLNPWAAPSRCTLDLPRGNGPVIDWDDKSIYHVADDNRRSQAIVDIPGAGFVAWQPTGSGTARPAVNKTSNKIPYPAIAQASHAKRSAARNPEDFVLANEFMRVEINPKSGSLRALHSKAVRGNRLSQQLAVRASRGDRGNAIGNKCQTSYSRMESQSVAITEESEFSTIEGVIEVVGQLVSEEDGRELAKFRQTYRLRRGSRVLDLTIQLEPVRKPVGNPWEDYYACRFAWPDPSSQLFRTLHGTRQATSLRRIDSPLYVDIDDEVERTTLLVGGLPFHHRVAPRMLDTLLVVQGESERTFQLGIGIGLPSPYAEASSQLAPPVVIDSPQDIATNTGWLCHLGVRNIEATAWQPRLASDCQEKSTCRGGLRVRLLETMGEITCTTVQFCRPIRRAQLLGFDGAAQAPCELIDGAVKVHLAAHEWIELEVQW